MAQGKITKKRKIFLGVIAFAILIGGYAYLSQKQHLKNPDDKTLPNVSQLKEGVQKIFEENQRSEERWILVDSLATGKRLFLGLGLSIILSVIIGLLMGYFKSVEAFILPPLNFLAKIPPTAALAVFFVMVGTNTKMYVAMITFGIAPIMAMSTYLAIKDIAIEQTNAGLTLGCSRMEVLWHVIFPQILPKIFDAIRLQIGPALVYLIAAEMVCGDVGFGYRIRIQFKQTNMNIVYPYLIALGIFGLVTDTILKIIVRRLCKWSTPN